MKTSLLIYSYVCAVLMVAGQWLWKLGLRQEIPGELRTFSSWVQLLVSPRMILGILSYGSATILWIIILRKYPLGVAYPLIISLALLNSVLVSRFFLGETLGLAQLLGLLLLLTSVVLLTARV